MWESRLNREDHAWRDRGKLEPGVARAIGLVIDGEMTVRVANDGNESYYDGVIYTLMIYTKFERSAGSVLR